MSPNVWSAKNEAPSSFLLKASSIQLCINAVRFLWLSIKSASRPSIRKENKRRSPLGRPAPSLRPPLPGFFTSSSFIFFWYATNVSAKLQSLFEKRLHLSKEKGYGAYAIIAWRLRRRYRSLNLILNLRQLMLHYRLLSSMLGAGLFSNGVSMSWFFCSLLGLFSLLVGNLIPPIGIFSLLVGIFTSRVCTEKAKRWLNLFAFVSA